MIKLLDDISLLDFLSTEEPYFGCILSSAAVATLPQPELMSIWVELDEGGNPVSALNVSKDELTLIACKKGVGLEMLMFMQKLAESGDITEIVCGDSSYPVLKKLFPAKIEQRAFMRCSNPPETEPPVLKLKKEGNIKDLLALRSSAEEDCRVKDEEGWLLRMTRGVLRGQTTVLTLHDGEKAVAAAVIRGRSKIAGAITSVITLPEFRGRGYASFLTAECARILQSEGRTAWLVPIDEKTAGLYEKIGFRAAGNEYTFLLEKDKNI